MRYGNIRSNANPDLENAQAFTDTPSVMESGMTESGRVFGRGLDIFLISGRQQIANSDVKFLVGSWLCFGSLCDFRHLTGHESDLQLHNCPCGYDIGAASEEALHQRNSASVA
jgi:hypothetical protein